MSNVGRIIGSTALVLTGAELITQAINTDQQGIVATVISDPTAQRVTKGVLGGIALLSLFGLAFDGETRKLKQAKKHLRA
jgi:hypothetical protein